MKLKKLSSLLLVSSMILAAPLATYANSLDGVDDYEISDERSVSSKQVWIWTKYPDAWKIVFFKENGVGKVKVYMNAGDQNYFVEVCDSIVSGSCYVEE